MALVLGTNCGFVETAPSTDPEGVTTINIDYTSNAFKDITPARASKVTEIGWYTPSTSEESNFEVGIYSHNIGDDNPEAVVGALSQTNAKGTTSGWKVVTGLNIPVTGETTYWIAIQCDNTSTATNIDFTTTGGEKADNKVSQTGLLDPWGSSNSSATRLMATYALVELGDTTTRASGLINKNLIYS